MSIRILLIVVILSFFNINVQAEDIKRAEELLSRIAPQALKHVKFRKIKTSKDVFELVSEDNKVVIKGNNANSMAVGLNYYLKNYCFTNVSWFSTDSVELPDVLPLVTPLRLDAKCKNRFFLNYCTFGYTMPWWGWSEWERFIDWMALNGINMPLAITGQEAIWFKVWQKMGLSDDEVRNYFTGPAHLPWHRMSNLDYWQGNLPDSWLENQLNLQKRILKRERELNMTPILPAFAGHVPKELAEKYPQARISRMSSWGGFKDEYRSHFLDPMDPLFVEIQKSFLTEQMNEFGTDHVYGADPFNEVDPPNWDPDFLAKVSKQIYGSMTAVDPKAQWLQMTWIFYHDNKNWTKPRLDAFINGVPKDKMLLLDYYCENTEIWKMTDQFYGQPYLWCYLGNFGGNTMLAGNFEEVGKRLDNVFLNGGANLTGVGATLEALDVNPFMYEFVFNKVWNTEKDNRKWIENLADCRNGGADNNVRKAWANLINQVYIKPSRLGQGCMTNSRPQFNGRGKWVNPTISYSNEDLYNIWGNLLRAESKSRASYKFDIVNVGRQFLGNYFNSLYSQFSKAHENENLDSLVLVGAQMIELLNDLDLLLSTNPSFSLRKWISDARKIGRNIEEANYYEKNARTLLTTWGERDQSLNDYANRQWFGLVSSYYKPRWEMFINDVISNVSQNVVFDQDNFKKKVMDFEWDWVNSTMEDFVEKSADPVKIAHSLYKKYGKPNDWAGLKRYNNIEEKSDSPKVVFLGNSITEGWVKSDSSFFADNNYSCRGISGQTSSQMLVRMQKDVIRQNPKMMVLLCGANDIAGNNGIYSFESILDNIKSIVQLAESNNIKVMLCSILPASSFGWNKSAVPAMQIAHMNNKIKDYAKMKDLPYVDYYSQMVDESGGLKSHFTYDCVHCTKEGYDMMRNIITPILSKELINL